MSATMRTHRLTYSVQVAGNRREEYVAAFASYAEALNFAERLAATAHESGSRQMFNVWNEESNERVHVIYPAGVAA